MSVVASANVSPAAIPSDASSGIYIAAAGVAYLPPPSVASNDRPERDDKPEQAELSFVIAGLNDALRNTSRKIGETAARAIHYTSFGLIADTVLSLGFERAADSDLGLLWQKELEARQLIVGSAAVVTTSLSVGYVVWMLRGGTLVASFMSSIPAWCSFDPLPIVDSFENTRRSQDHSMLDESLASIAGPESCGRSPAS